MFHNFRKGLDKNAITDEHYTKALIKIDATKEVCQYRSKWRNVISAYTNGEKEIIHTHVIFENSQQNAAIFTKDGKT